MREWMVPPGHLAEKGFRQVLVITDGDATGDKITVADRDVSRCS